VLCCAAARRTFSVIFGILILLSELRLVFLLKWFSFLTFFGGLGGFYSQ